MLVVSYFNSWLDRTPTPLPADSFADLCSKLSIGDGLHTATTVHKTETPAFSPCTYAPGATRGRRGVHEMTLYVADFDRLPAADFKALLMYLQEAQLSYAIYSTYSHRSGDTYSFRLLIPLTTAVPAENWAYVWPQLTARLPVSPDQSCKDTSRMYGLPHTPFLQDAFAEVVTSGNPMGVPAAAPTGAQLRHAADTGSLPLLQRGVWPAQAEFAEWVKYLQANRRASTQRAWLYDVAKAVLDARPFANLAQGRHETLLPLTQAMERRWAHVEIDAIVELFEPALTTMARDSATQGEVDVPKRLEEIARLLTGARNLRQQAAPALAAARNDSMLGAPAGMTTAQPDGRILRANDNDSTPYTPAELAIMAEYAGSPGAAAPPTDTWLIHKGRSVYVLTDRGYVGPTQESDFVSTAWRLLTRAGLTMYNSEGKPLAVGTLCRMYGTELANISMSYTSRATAFNPNTRTLTERAAQPRADLLATAPQADPHVAKWLELLCGGPGPTHERVLDWLACILRLDEPLAALYLNGPSGVGKNLLAVSLARIFHSGGPAGLGTVLDGKWNNALMTCPVVVADESMPSSATFENVCEFIGTTSRDLLRKYAPNATLQGATRLLLTANKDDLFAFAHQGRKTYTKEQFEAVARRVLYVQASPAAAKYLREEAPEHYTWLQPQHETISRHILWLAQSRQVQRQPGARFLVEGNFELMLDKFVDTNPLISKIIEWCARLLRNPRPLLAAHGTSAGNAMPWLSTAAPGDMSALDFAGADVPGAGSYLWLSPGLLNACWAQVLGESRKDAPDAARLQPALAALGIPNMLRPAAVPAGLYPVPVRHMLRWCAAVGFDHGGNANAESMRLVARVQQGSAVALDTLLPPVAARLTRLPVAGGAA